MHNPSRRCVAKFIADQLAAGESPRRVAKVLAAYLTETNQKRLAGLLLRDIRSALLHQHRHLAAGVTSARKLDPQILTDLRTMLLKETNAKTAEIVERVKPSLIGGIIVRTPDAEMDASLRAKLQKLRAI